MKITIASALDSLRPKSSYIVTDNTYEGIQWEDTVQEKPTKEEVLNELSRLQEEYNSKEYQRLRKVEYPPLEDLADALYWQSQGDDTKMQEYINAINKVKLAYPKS